MIARWTSHPQVPEHHRRTAVASAATLALLLCVASTAVAQEAEAKWWSSDELRLILVNTLPWVEAIQPDGGWQLTIDIQARNRELLGIGTPTFPPYYPDVDRTGYLVFDDPDRCPSFIAFGFQTSAYTAYYCGDTPIEVYEGCVPPFWPDDPQWPGGYDCPPGDPTLSQAWYDKLVENDLAWARDETWAELTSGLSVLYQDPDGGTFAIVEDRPEIWEYGQTCDEEDPPNCVPGWVRSAYGPDLGITSDDITYGRSRRLPGLVVVADHGPGVRWVAPEGGAPAPDFFDPLEPAEAWNLAGFVNSVAYSLKGGTTETSVLVHMNVPSELFKPVVLADNDLGSDVQTADGTCDAETAGGVYRMDGGPLRCYEDYFGTLDDLLYGTTVTVRVFVVDGVAPNVLTDEDGDGDIDIRDVELMGYDPISRQEGFRFRQWAEDECGYRFDFDGNNNPGFCVAPARPGGIVRPPR